LVFGLLSADLICGLFGWWLVLICSEKKSIANWLVAGVGLSREKNTSGWWLIIQTNMVHGL
jgi:hypothetical protein